MRNTARILDLFFFAFAVIGIAVASSPALAQTFVPGGTIAIDTTWTSAGSPYVIQGNVTVQGTDGGDALTTLTIDPGVTVAFDGNYELLVGNTSGNPGALIADAGGSTQIVFTSNQGAPAAGDWLRIRFENTVDASTTLNNVLVEYAGSGSSTGALYLNQGSGTTLALVDVTVQNSATFDFRLFRGTTDIDGCTIDSFHYWSNSPRASWDGCTFNNWGDRISRVGLADVDSLTHGNTFNVGGAVAMLRIFNGTLSNDQSWGTAAGRLVPQGTILVQGTDGGDGVTTLTIEPGATVAMPGNYEIVAGNTSGNPGALVADAAGQAQIVFTSDQASPAPGDWLRIRFENTAHASTTLNNVLIEYAGSGNSTGAIYANQGAGTTIVLQDVTIQNSNTFDIRLFRGILDVDDSTMESFGYWSNNPHATWDNCTFNNWGDRSSIVALNDVDEVTHGNTFNPGSAGAELRVYGGTLSLDASWSLAAGKLLPLATIIVQGTDGVDAVTTLTIEPGVTVAMPGNYEIVAGNTSGNPGALVADAAGQSQIIFTSDRSSPAPGDWLRIRFENTAHSSTILDNVLIQYAGSGNSTGAIYANQGAATTIAVRDVAIQFSATFDIRLFRGTLDVDDSTMESFGYWSNAPQATWDNCTFNNWGDRSSIVALNDVDEVTHGNTFNVGTAGAELRVHGGTATLDSSWSTAAGKLIPLSNITIQGADGADSVTTVNLEPGLTVAMNGNYWLQVGGASGNPGALIADAGGQTEILFTSNLASPVPGSWNKIYFYTTAHLSTVLRNVRLEYGGSGINTGSIYANQGAGVTLVLDQVTVQNTANFGIWLQRGILDIDNCAMESFWYSGNTPRATWDGCTFDNWGDRISRAAILDVDAVTHGNTFNVGALGAQLQVWNGTATLDASWGTDAGRLVPVGNITVQGADGGDGVTTLNLEPGSIVAMNGNYWLQVGGASGNPGALNADAGGQTEILFTSNLASPVPGSWNKIYFYTTAHDSTLLRNVRLEYGGSGVNTGSIFANQAAGVTIVLDQVTVQNTANRGLWLQRGILDVDDCAMESFWYAGNSPHATWDGCTFDNWGDLLSRTALDDVDEVTHGNTFNVGGSVAQLQVWNGTATLDSSWGTDAGRLVPVGNITIQGVDGGDGLTTLNLEPGLTVAMNGNHSLQVGGTSGNPGALIADAGGQAEILFTSNLASPVPGSWGRILLYTTADVSTLLRNVRLEYAGSGSSTGAISAFHAAGTTLVLDQVTVQNSGNFGVWLQTGILDVDDCVLESLYYGNSAARATWDGCTFNQWGVRTSRVGIEDVDALTHGNTFNIVPGSFTQVWAGTATADASWAADAGPLHSTGTITVRGTDGADTRTSLTLEPGVTLKFPNGHRLDVGWTSGDPGELIVSGAAGARVNFTSTNSVPNIGDWTGLRVLNTGRAAIQHAQFSYPTTALQVLTGTLGPVDTVAVNRAVTGFDFQNATFEQQLDRLRTKNCTTGVLASNSSPTVRFSDLIGGSFGVNNTTPTTHCVDAAQNWWGDPSGPAGALPAVGCNTADPQGVGSTISEGVLFTPWLDAPDDDGDGIDADDGDGFEDPCTGGNTVDCDDNCPLVANPSQGDRDGDGVGDACDSNPTLTVSTDPLDLADFDVIQDAVDAAFESGSKIRIFPGLGPYFESVRLDVDKVFTIERADDGTQDPVIVDGGAGPAFQVINKVGSVPMRFRELTLRGDRGVLGLVDTFLFDVQFDLIVNEALDLDAGSHLLEVGSIAGARVGADVAAGADVTIRRTSMIDLLDCGIVTAGSATTENVLIVDSTDGIRLSAGGGSAAVHYTTIADNTGYGIDNGQGGTVTVDRSVLWNNALGDMTGVACTAVDWSDSGAPDCSGTGNNVSADPLFDIDYTLQAGSACLDFGPDPSLYMGDPPTDLDGGQRLLDFDGDQLATNDCGAFEMPAAGPLVGEVSNVRFLNGFTIEWDVEPSAVEYHVYRDELGNLGYASYAVCRDDLDATRTDTQLIDFASPAPGVPLFYLITAEEVGGTEGTLGFGTSTERSNFPANICP